jgi:4-amino-4-deoxy-L-arabinose transferase-like glycosyltransferase
MTSGETREPPNPKADGCDLRIRPPLRDALLIAGLTLLALVPFSGKAIHIDDPLFVWTAEHIQTNPLDPFGFDVNWYGSTAHMSDVTKNPPLTSYYIAMVAHAFGWGERPLHVAFLVPALMIVLLTFLLAELLGARPLPAALSVLVTPAFLVSSTTLMSDTWMLALWMSAVYLWITGTRERSALRLLSSSVIVALAALTKYFAVSLIPLLLIYSLVRNRRMTSAAAYLLVPMSVLFLYQVWTQAHYGHGLLMDAATYASQRNAWTLDKLIIGLAFTGGCLGAVSILTYWCSGRRTWMVFSLVAVTLLFLRAIPVVEHHAARGTRNPWPAAPLLAVFAVGGLLISALSVRALLRRRDAETWLLSLWVLGTVAFAAGVNWSINARSILPLVPAVSIMLMRESAGLGRSPGRRAIGAVLVVTAALGLASAWADHALAQSARRAAQIISERHVGDGRPVLFEGHWGFQYYMQRLGASPIDFRRTPIHSGDVVVIPENNTNNPPLPADRATLLEEMEIPSSRWIATMHREIGAGFYADVFGPLPYAVGPVPPERYYVFEISLTGR